jgi:hypothetical protein
VSSSSIAAEPEVQIDLAVGKSVFVGAHDRHHARGLVGVSGIFGAAFHVGRVIIDLEKVRDAGK